MKKLLTRIGLVACALVCGFSLTACGTTNDPDDETVDATGISLSDDYQAVVNGETYTLTATVSPSDATETTVVWRSSNEEVATVSDAGVVTAVANGEATITATCGTYSDTCDIMVGTGVSSVSDLVFTDSTRTYYYILTADISNVTEEIQITAPTVFDLNGYSISTTANVSKPSGDTSSRGSTALIVVTSNNVTIKNGTLNTVISDSASSSAIYAYNSSETITSNYNVLIENMTITSNTHCVRTYAYTATIKDCTFTNNGSGNYGFCVNVLTNSNVTISGGEYSSSGNTVIGTNGSNSVAGSTIAITGATINATATNVASGEIACGIYLANNDTTTISSTTINVIDGAGIVHRGGTLTVADDVTINSTTTEGTTLTAGTVGDNMGTYTVSTGTEIVVYAYSGNYVSSISLTNNSTNSVAVIGTDGQTTTLSGSTYTYPTTVSD